MYTAHRLRVSFLSLTLLVVGASLVVWHGVADRVMEHLAATSPFLAEYQPPAGEQLAVGDIFSAGYYTELYRQEFGSSVGSTTAQPAKVDQLMSFVSEHSLSLSPPTSDFGTYKAQIAPLAGQWRVIDLKQLTAAITNDNKGQQQAMFSQAVDDLNHNLVALQTVTVAPDAQAWHQFHQATVVLLRGAVQQLTKTAIDPAGAVLAADTIDKLQAVFNGFHRQGIATYVAPGGPSALAALTGTLGYDRAAMTQPAHQVAGATSVACHVCLVIDSFLAKMSVP